MGTLGSYLEQPKTIKETEDYFVCRYGNFLKALKSLHILCLSETYTIELLTGHKRLKEEGQKCGAREKLKTLHLKKSLCCS